jgi:uncharacterized phage infection (PIP) family protein YhgE
MATLNDPEEDQENDFTEITISMGQLKQGLMDCARQTAKAAEERFQTSFETTKAQWESRCEDLQTQNQSLVDQLERAQLALQSSNKWAEELKSRAEKTEALLLYYRAWANEAEDKVQQLEEQLQSTSETVRLLTERAIKAEMEAFQWKVAYESSEVDRLTQQPFWVEYAESYGTPDSEDVPPPTCDAMTQTTVNTEIVLSDFLWQERSNADDVQQLPSGSDTPAAEKYRTPPSVQPGARGDLEGASCPILKSSETGQDSAPTSSCESRLMADQIVDTVQQNNAIPVIEDGCYLSLND